MKPALSLYALLATAMLAACSKPAPEPEPVRPVRTLVVQESALGGGREFAAEVRARTETRLSFRVPGKLVQRMVDVGQTVRAGQPVARLDVQDAQLSAQAARSALAGAQSNLALAQADFARFKQLREQGFISDAELQRRDASLKAAQAQFEQASAQASLAGNAASYSVLQATAAGVVTAVDAEPGMVLAAGAPVLRLAHDGPRDAVFAVPEDQVQVLRQWSSLPGVFSVRGWSAGAAWVPAKVREISASADPVSRTFTVKLDVGQAASLLLGQTATVQVTPPAGAKGLRLPLSALKEQGGASHVWVVEPGSMKVRLQPVQVAGAEGNDAVIAGGLSPGMRVVSAGVHVLVPGQQVRLLEAPSPVPAQASPPASAAQR